MTKQSLEQYLLESFSPTQRSRKRDEWARVYNEMNVHLNGAKPYNLIGTRRPKEDNEILQYRINNFEPITKGILRQAMDSLYRIFNDKNYELRLSPLLDRFINGAYFNGFNFMGWVQSILVYEMILDPNGVVVVLPTGNGLYDPTELAIPSLSVINSYRIIEANEDFLIFVDLPANVDNINDYYEKYRHHNASYWILDRQNIYTYQPIEEKGDTSYILQIYYTHNIGEVPYTVLGGEWDSNLQCYSSFFNSFIPFANEAIRQYSDWQGAMVTSAYPIRVYRQINCMDANCRNGYYDFDPITGAQLDYHNRVRCKTCGGTGKVPASSPYGVLIKPENNALNQSDNYDNSPLLEYITPPVDILAFAKEAWESMLDRAAQSLHITEEKTRAETGLAKKTEREREYALLLKISNNIYDNVIRTTLRYCERYLNVINPTEPQVIKPTTFDLRTEDDLIRDLKELEQANAPHTIIKEISKELLKRRYAGDLPTYYKQLFLMDYVPCLFDSASVQISLYQIGVYTKEDLIKAKIAVSFVDRLVNRGFDLDPSTFESLDELLMIEVKKRADVNNGIVPLQELPSTPSLPNSE